MTIVIWLVSVASFLNFWLPAAWPCNVTISPKEPAVMFGSSLSLNCTASCTNYTALKWEVSFSHEIQEGNGWTSLKINNVTQWNAQPLCFVVENEDSASTRTIIYAYEFSTPEIYLTPEIQSGNSEHILCNISRLKVRGSIPLNMNISLLRGGVVLSSNIGKSSVEYSFVANHQEDNGTEIRCEAFVQVGSELLRKQTKRILNVVETGRSDIAVVLTVVLVSLLVVIALVIFLYFCRKRLHPVGGGLAFWTQKTDVAADSVLVQPPQKG